MSPSITEGTQLCMCQRAQKSWCFLGGSPPEGGDGGDGSATVSPSSSLPGGDTRGVGAGGGLGAPVQRASQKR